MDVDAKTESPQRREPTFEELPKEVQIRALKDAIAFLAEKGYNPITPELLTEALGPEQLRVIGETIDYPGELDESQLNTIAENIPEDALITSLEKAADENIMTPAKDSSSNVLPSTLIEHPAAVYYTISLGFLMTAAYISSPVVALAGVGILLITYIHYAG